jgi:hypothetical protein
MDTESLQYFFRGYFHQDWAHDYGSYEEAVLDFCANETPERIAAVKLALLDLMDGEALGDHSIQELGGYMVAAGFGVETRELLRRIVGRMS